MKPENFDIHELIESLQGTCNTLEDHLPEGMDFTDLTQEDHQSIANEIFLCDQCGWWYETCEEDGEEFGTCQDCADSGRDAEDD